MTPEHPAIAAVWAYLTTHEQINPLGREQWNADIREIIAAAQPATYKSGQRVSHYSEGSGTVYQDQAFPNTIVHVEFDSRRGVAQGVNPRDLHRI